MRGSVKLLLIGFAKWSLRFFLHGASLDYPERRWFKRVAEVRVSNKPSLSGPIFELVLVDRLFSVLVEAMLPVLVFLCAVQARVRL
jgi:hypothetical protein